MATFTFNQRADDLLAKMDALMARLSSPVVKAPVEPIRPIAVASAAAGPVVETTSDVIPKYASPQFAELTQKQQHFVRKVLNMVIKENGINMAEITNPMNDGIPFPKEDFPGKKFGDVIRIYTTLVKEGDNLFTPPEKLSKGAKKATVWTLKSIEEFNEDFAKAIEEVRANTSTECWADEPPSEVLIQDVLDEFADLTQYEIDETDPCASLNRSRFLIDETTGMVSIIPEDE